MRFTAHHIVVAPTIDDARRYVESRPQFRGAALAEAARLNHYLVGRRGVRLHIVRYDRWENVTPAWEMIRRAKASGAIEQIHWSEDPWSTRTRELAGCRSCGLTVIADVTRRGPDFRLGEPPVIRTDVPPHFFMARDGQKRCGGGSWITVIAG